MGVEVRQLRALVAVVDEGSFTDAAIALGVSQAAVSRAVAGLEATLGVRVLRRTTRTIAVTSAGQDVLARARRVLHEVDAMRDIAHGREGEVRLGYAWSALGRRTTPVLRRWERLHPGGAIDLVPSNTPSAGVLEGVADVGIVRHEVLPAGVGSRLVGTERRVVAVAADDAWARRRFVRLADFAGRVVAVDPRTGTTTRALWGDDLAVRLRDVHGVERWLNTIAAGAAVGMSTTATADQHTRPEIVYRLVRDAEPVPVRAVWLVDDPPPALDALLAVLCESYVDG